MVPELKLGLSGRWIAWLIRVFPGRLRTDFGDDLLTAFLDQRDEAARSARMPRFAIAISTIGVSWELVKAGAAERMVIRKRHGRLLQRWR